MGRPRKQDTSAASNQQPFFNDFDESAKSQNTYDLSSLFFGEKMFTAQKYALSLLKDLSVKIKYLDIPEIFWISRCEEFLHEKKYISRRQLEVLKQINDKYTTLQN